MEWQKPEQQGSDPGANEHMTETAQSSETVTSDTEALVMAGGSWFHRGKPLFYWHLSK